MGMKQLRITKKVTNRESIAFDKYLQEVAKYDLITAEEEADLAVKIKEGDTEALDKLIKANLRFVISVAKQFQNKGLSLSDLVNEGNIGLIKAARRFDEKKGFKFISYAVWWIRQSIIQSLAEYSRIVRLPLNKIGSINKVNKVFYELLQTYQREPTHEEIAKELDMFPEDVRKAILHKESAISMDAPLDEDEKRNMYSLMQGSEVLNPEKTLLKESLKKELIRALNTLPHREAEIIRQYYGIDMEHPQTLEEIGLQFDLTRERIRQIKSRALKSLKSRSKLLAEYL